MNSLIENLKEGYRFFNSGTKNSPEFEKFYKNFKRNFKRQLTFLNAKEIQFNKGHFYISGFFKVGEQWVYFSLADVRHSFGTAQGTPMMLVRMADGPDDYKGKMNCYVKISSRMCEDIAKLFGFKIHNVSKSKQRVQDKVQKFLAEDFCSFNVRSFSEAEKIAFAIYREVTGKGCHITQTKRGRVILSLWADNSVFKFSCYRENGVGAIRVDFELKNK